MKKQNTQNTANTQKQQSTQFNVSRETLKQKQQTALHTSRTLYAMQKDAQQKAKAQTQKQAQAEAQTDAEEQNTFIGYADRYAQAAETVRDTHFLLSLDAVKHCSQLANSYRDRQRTAWTEATETARTLASIIAASVIKKCDNVAASEMTRQLRNSRTQDVHRMETAAARIAEQITVSTNKNGDTVTEYSEDYAKVASDVFETILDGADLYQTAYETIMAEGADGIDFEYTERVLDRRVAIRKEDSAAWKEVEMTAGQKAHKAVRALIENSRAAVDNNRYCYLSEIVKDSENSTEADAAEAVLYHRLPKFFSEMDTAQDSGFNSHPVPVTVSETDFEEYETLCEQSAETLSEQFNLSAQQKDILSKLFLGYGKQATATYIGTNIGNVCNQITRTKQKVKASDWYAEHTAATAQAEAILFLLETEAEDSKTAAQRATEATDSARKAAQAADAAQKNAFRAAQHAAEYARTAARTARTAAEKAEQAAALSDFWKAAQAAQAADKTARTAQAAARIAQKQAQAAQAAARAERKERLHR